MPEPTKTVYINFFDEINPQRVNLFINMCSQVIQQHKPDIFQINFSSPGGNVAAGMVLFNFLRALPQKLVIHNIGSVDSIATVIFLAGKVRIANPNSTFLFHGVLTGFQAQVQLTRNQLAERLEGLVQDEEKIAGAIKEMTKISQGELDSLSLRGEVKSPEYALEKGIIHKIEGLQLPKDAIIFTFV